MSRGNPSVGTDSVLQSDRGDSEESLRRHTSLLDLANRNAAISDLNSQSRSNLQRSRSQESMFSKSTDERRYALADLDRIVAENERILDDRSSFSNRSRPVSAIQDSNIITAINPNRVRMTSQPAETMDAMGGMFVDDPINNVALSTLNDHQCDQWNSTIQSQYQKSLMLKKSHNQQLRLLIEDEQRAFYNIMQREFMDEVRLLKQKLSRYILEPINSSNEENLPLNGTSAPPDQETNNFFSRLSKLQNSPKTGTDLLNQRESSNLSNNSRASAGSQTSAREPMKRVILVEKELESQSSSSISSFRSGVNSAREVIFIKPPKLSEVVPGQRTYMRKVDQENIRLMNETYQGVARSGNYVDRDASFHETHEIGVGASPSGSTVSGDSMPDADAHSREMIIQRNYTGDRLVNTGLNYRYSSGNDRKIMRNGSFTDTESFANGTKESTPYTLVSSFPDQSSDVSDNSIGTVTPNKPQEANSETTGFLYYPQRMGRSNYVASLEMSRL
ncbi:hypothetical protein Ciccas_003351 [Cichlidogyrus casuarinus]|uniref:Uncharacterized protein n=1 Tax=Cichlidogyrus casuarinus TaxID=1844966 RepID=A0ABD2QEM7_9PLAT